MTLPSDHPPDGGEPPSLLLTALLAIVGAVLLLPGVCALVFIGMFSQGGSGSGISAEPLFFLLWIVCFAISFGGIMMLRAATRRTRRRFPPPPPPALR